VGVIEISTGGDFEDLGPKILSGRYNGNDSATSLEPADRQAGLVEGRLGTFQPVEWT
jgi:hypothetical protein